MAEDTPRKILEDISRTLRFHAELGLESYGRSEAIQSFLDISLEPKPSAPSPAKPRRTTAAASHKKAAAPEESRRAHKTLEDIRRELGDCTRCGLHAGRSRILFGAGPPDARLLIVGEWPNRGDDAEGVFFSGKEGELLRKMVQAIGVDLDDVYLTNTVKCRASEERPPEKEHLAACRPFLLSQIDTISPKVIVTMGPLAAQVMLGTNKLLVRLRGRVHTYKAVPLIPTFQPSYLLKNPEMKKAAWVDLQLVQRELNR
jgi:DNA polymerase